MSALRIWKQIQFHPALWLAITLAIAGGCNDAPSPNKSTTVNSLTNELPTTETPSAWSKVEGDGQPGTGVDSLAQATPHVASRDPIAAPVAPIGPPAPKESVAIPAVKPEEVYEPKVVLSAAHEKACVVNVGDTLPDLALKSMTGEPVSLKELRGEKLTVVVFWTNRLAFSREQFARLSSEIARPFRYLGVKVVAVNVGDPVEQIELDPATHDDFTCVLDPDGSATAQVSVSKLPRTYLIDGDGRILWFDIEYSRSTRRQLKNAIFYCSRDASASES